jgi:hypothetical protein
MSLCIFVLVEVPASTFICFYMRLFAYNDTACSIWNVNFFHILSAPLYGYFQSVDFTMFKLVDINVDIHPLYTILIIYLFK